MEPSWVSQVNQKYASVRHKGADPLWDSTEDPSFQDVERQGPYDARESTVVQSNVASRDLGKLSDCESQQRPFRDSYDGQRFSIKDEAIRAGAFNASAVAAAEVNYLTVAQKSGESDKEKIAVLQQLSDIYEQYEIRVLRQLLARYSLSQTWSDIILPIVRQIVKSVKLNPDRNRGEMDIRPSVQLKKIPGGEQSDCVVVNGVVCTKNVAHKKMRSCIISPTILLIKSPIIYQRQENKFLSLEPALLQETSYLRNVVAKIIALRPDVVLVENTVSRLAQNFFLEADITLVLNVKSSVMNRIARLTNASVTTSIEAHFPKPQLGTCKMLSLTNYLLPDGSSKTLMTFDGCDAHLGCTVLLRGASNTDLCTVKRLMKFMIFMNFNQKLEMSFLGDELALPPDRINKTRFIESPADSEDSARHVNVEKILKRADECQMNDRQGTESGFNTDDSELSCDSNGNGSGQNDFNGNEVDVLFRKTCHPKFKSISEALDFIMLSISPSVCFEAPVFENGEHSRHFPGLVYWSSYLEETEDSSNTDYIANDIEDEFAAAYYADRTRAHGVDLLESHPFVGAQFCNPVYHGNVQNLLSNFRAKGGYLYSTVDLPWMKTAETFATDKAKDKWSNSRFDYDSGERVKLDVLDPFNHQSISVSFCSYSYHSSNSPYFCIDPWIVRMGFYGLNDVTLGGFLEKYCFRATYTCPSSTCDTSMVNHVRRFVHNDGCINILMHKMDEPLSSGPDAIMVWNWCRKCKVSSKMTEMSAASRALSFAKYLDLRFHNQSYIKVSQKHCAHTLHHDHFQYFGCGDTMAVFKYTSVTLHEVRLPATTLHKSQNYITTEESLVDEIRTLAVSGHGIFDTVQEKLQDLSTEPLSGKSDVATDRITQLQSEKNFFREEIKEIQIKLTSLVEEKNADQSNKNCGEFWEVIDNIVAIKRHLAEAVFAWNMRLTECIQMRRKEDRATKQPSSVAKPVTQASQIEHHDIESVACQASGAKSDSNSTRSSVALEHSEDDRGLQCLEEPCLDYYGYIANTESADSSDRNSNHSLEISDGKVTIETPIAGSERDTGLDTPKAEKKSSTLVKTMFSQLLSLPSAVTLPMPFPQTEHHILPHCEKVPLVVYENEPSSVIAYSLCSADYELGIQEMKHASDSSSKISASKDVRETSSTSSVKPKASRSLEKCFDVIEDKCEVNKDSSQNTDELPELSIKDEEVTNPHLEVQFADTSTKFYCRVYFAKQFLKLREVVLPEGEEMFIRCLSRCSEWQANGGKSGCLFCKTHDDRFILKQMTRLEVQSFLEFAPYYIDYMLQASSEQKPAALVKILGAFQITFRPIAHANATTKMDLLVMENLFYGHEINKTFDLKGSIRNRLVNISRKDGTAVVLQDENLLKMACDYPLYVRQHSKLILSYAIKNDTRFLSDHLIMDYSLLVGVDEKNKELVVGIIDYIRTFTWDKKLENLVKSTGILGGQGRLPTVVSPELYRNRFCEAMDRYILMVPDQWTELGPMDL